MASIVTCPKCQTLVLSDTVQCPGCKTVLIESRSHEVAPISANTVSVVSNHDSINEHPCRECGVMVRKGVVRCFNCGTFTNPDIEAKFIEKQDSQMQIMYSELEDSDEKGFADSRSNSSSDTGFHTSDFNDSSARDEGDPDDDFQLSDDIEMLDWNADDEGADFEYDEADRLSNSESDVEISNLEELDASTEETSSEEATSEVLPGADHVDDGLFSIAMLEEAEQASKRRRQLQTSKRQMAKFLKSTDQGIMMLPPCRCCAIRIQPHQLGASGVCPKCKLSFRIPAPKTQARVILTKTETSASTVKNVDHRFENVAVVDQVGEFQVWLRGLWFHNVDLAKFKPAEDLLLKQYVPVDLGFSPDQVIAIPLAKKPGNYAEDDAKVQEARQKYLLRLADKTKTLDQNKDLEIMPIMLGTLSRMNIIDPIQQDLKAQFEGINIWGQGRIYVELPSTPATAEKRTFLSMTISQYRELSRILTHLYGYTRFHLKSTTPIELKTEELACMFSKKNFDVLSDGEYYRHDSRYQLNLLGHVCQSCHKFLSEESRTDKKLGSAANKPPSKMKCLACGKKFGELPRFEIAKKQTDAPKKGKAKAKSSLQ